MKIYKIPTSFVLRSLLILHIHYTKQRCRKKGTLHHL